MPFSPASLVLEEVGAQAPALWQLTAPLAWSGTRDGRPDTITVPASPASPFVTDLASVPRVFTWLIPRYGRYTKAAVVHDFLCQCFSRATPGAPDPPVRDRSDADGVFFALMGELGVPWLRRGLMWAAVGWATLLSTASIGRRRSPRSRLLGRTALVLTVVGFAAWLVLGHDRVAVAGTVLGAPIGVIVAGVVALGRLDRVPTYALVYVTTLLALPLLVLGVPVTLALVVYLLVEEVAGGLPTLRRLWANLTSPSAKLAQVATPQFARLTAISES